EQTVTDIDGNTYHTVKIGTQTWMVENLKTTKFNDGSTIPLVSDGYEWSNLTTPGYCWYSNILLDSKDTYGALDSWYTVNTGKLAPIGWHVPTQSEIDTLANHLGGYPLAGSLLKESGNTHWYAGNSDATNSSGFTALPGGYRSSITGDYHNSGMWGVFWSSTEVNNKGGRYILSNTSSAFEYNSDGKKCGFSVRCIKDSTTNSTLPSFVLSNISSITDSSAICTGKIGSDGGSPVTDRGVCWSISQNPTISDNKSSAGVGAGVYNCNIAGLLPNTTYYARAYATNSIGTAYDIQVSFSTLKNDSAIQVKWTVYNTSNSGLSNNNIFAVTIDSLNNKWIGSNLSTIMDKFNGSNWTNYTNDKISTVHGGNLVIDKKGDKWIVGEGLNRFNDSTWTNYNTVNSNLPDNYIYAVAVDSNNTKWIGTREAGLVKFNDSTWTIYNSSNSGIPNTKIYSLAIDKSGDIWIGTAFSGIVKFDGTNYTNYNSYNSPLPSDDIYSISVDPNGNLWFGTYNGVAKFNGSVWTIYNTFNSGLSGNYIRSFGFTDDGSVWIGTVGNGLSRLKGNEWTVYNTSNSELPNDNVLSIAIEKNQNKIWLGTLGGGLASIEF
ncbi:MAG: FISUMP domain-containing protein, partial [Paludibacter sp.]|nr:FISUMP domain-containing protein [Paludibacter sp.]